MFIAKVTPSSSSRCARIREFRTGTPPSSRVCHRNVGGILAADGHGAAAIVHAPGVHRVGPEGRTVKGEDKKITFDVKGFFQSNVGMLEKTIEIIKKDFGGQHLLDMYAGVGTFSTFLSDNFTKTTLVEHNRDAISLAEINLHGKNHESYGVSGEKWVNEYADKIKTEFDGVVIDPPRSGMEKSVLKWLCSSNIPSIRSVSCDPITHARDIKELVKNGYNLKEIYLLDYYPQTTHIESLVILEKD